MWGGGGGGSVGRYEDVSRARVQEAGRLQINASAEAENA